MKKSITITITILEKVEMLKPQKIDYE